MNTCLASYPETNSKHWFTTSFLWRRVPESYARSVIPRRALSAFLWQL